MKKIETDTQSMYGCADKIAEEIERIKTTINGTYDGVRALDAMWEGMAKREFDRQFAKDSDRLHEICADLAKYAERLNEACRAYEESEQAVEKIVSAIRF